MRVNSLLQQEISLILQRELLDPELSLTTITEVEVAPDLRSARVYASVIGEEEEMRLALSALKRNRKHIQELLADRVDLRYTPRLTFIADRTAAQAQRIETILHHLAEEAAEREDETEPEDEE
jgi:ribosome-binding factor A